MTLAPVSGTARRTVALLVASALVAVVSGSCRGVVAGDSTDALSQLCEQLAFCFGEATCEGLEERLRTGSRDDAIAFLERYDPDDCLATCSSSLACLDVAPLCSKPSSGTSDSCASDAGCCGWTVGLSACDGVSCCLPRGVECAGEADCCDGRCEVPVDGDSGDPAATRYCGGVRCALVGTECSFAAECCTGLCLDGVCAARSCGGLGAPCASSADCCDSLDSAVASSDVLVCGPEGTCQLAATVCAVGESCDPADPCCGDDELCFPLGGPGLGICGTQECLPPRVECGNDEACCGDSACLADALGVRRCLPSSCKKLGRQAASAEECCSGRIADGACAPAEESCVEPTDHCPLLAGPPIPPDGNFGPCVALVAMVDDYCACFEWDESCVATALKLCGPSVCAVP